MTVNKPVWIAMWCVALTAVAVEPPAFELSRTTIDGGGAMSSTGEGFELSGTIGQPDAGLLTGGGFDLIGGFWFEIPLGDCEEDGDVGLMDHYGQARCLVGPGGNTPTTECRCFDVNRSGTVDMADVAIVQLGFTGD